jgi:hypothetical protein
MLPEKRVEPENWEVESVVTLSIPETALMEEISMGSLSGGDTFPVGLHSYVRSDNAAR